MSEATMTCIEIAEPGGPEVLRPTTRPRPVAGPGDVLVKVAAAGVNRPDVVQRQGNYKPPPGATDIPGLEIAGTVAALGDGVTGLKIGDPVCALVVGGGYAEYCPAPAAQCLPIPKGLSPVEGGALPETFFTVWTNLYDRGRLQPGETLLIHGGSSGIGTTAIQVAAAFGAKVITTAGSAEKCEACVKLGAAKAINYREQDFVEAVKEFTGGKGADVIVDMVGGDYIEKNLRALAVEGRLVSIGFQKGAKAEINFMPMMLKRQTITGSTLRIQSVESKGRIARSLREKVWPLIEQGRIRPIVHATFPLAQAADAHRLMESSAHIGKIVLTVQGP